MNLLMKGGGGGGGGARAPSAPPLDPPLVLPLAKQNSVSNNIVKRCYVTSKQIIT